MSDSQLTLEYLSLVGECAAHPGGSIDQNEANRILYEFCNRSDSYVYFRQILESDCSFELKYAVTISLMKVVQGRWKDVPFEIQNEIQDFMYEIVFMATSHAFSEQLLLKLCELEITILSMDTLDLATAVFEGVVSSFYNPSFSKAKIIGFFLSLTKFLSVNFAFRMISKSYIIESQFRTVVPQLSRVIIKELMEESDPNQIIVLTNVYSGMIPWIPSKDLLESEMHSILMPKFTSIGSLMKPISNFYCEMIINLHSPFFDPMNMMRIYNNYVLGYIKSPQFEIEEDYCVNFFKSLFSMITLAQSCQTLEAMRKTISECLSISLEFTLKAKEQLLVSAFEFWGDAFSQSLTDEVLKDELIVHSVQLLKFALSSMPPYLVIEDEPDAFGREVKRVSPNNGPLDLYSKTQELISIILTISPSTFDEVIQSIEITSTVALSVSSIANSVTLEGFHEIAIAIIESYYHVVAESSEITPELAINTASIAINSSNILIRSPSLFSFIYDVLMTIASSDDEDNVIIALYGISESLVSICGTDDSIKYLLNELMKRMGDLFEFIGDQKTQSILSAVGSIMNKLCEYEPVDNYVSEFMAYVMPYLTKFSKGIFALDAESFYSFVAIIEGFASFLRNAPVVCNAALPKLLPSLEEILLSFSKPDANSEMSAYVKIIKGSCITLLSVIVSNSDVSKNSAIQNLLTIIFDDFIHSIVEFRCPEVILFLKNSIAYSIDKYPQLVEYYRTITESVCQIINNDFYSYSEFRVPFFELITRILNINNFQTYFSDADCHFTIEQIIWGAKHPQPHIHSQCLMQISRFLKSSNHVIQDKLFSFIELAFTLMKEQTHKSAMFRITSMIESLISLKAISTYANEFFNIITNIFPLAPPVMVAQFIAALAENADRFLIRQSINLFIESATSILPIDMVANRQDAKAMLKELSNERNKVENSTELDEEIDLIKQLDSLSIQRT